MNSEEPKTLHIVQIFGKRFLVIGGIVALVYSIIGSMIFPDWYYQIFWNKGFADPNIWQGGVDYWIQTPLLLFGVGALAIVAIFLVHRYRTRFWPLVDRRWKWVVSVVAVGMLITVLAVREYGRLTYGPVQQIIALNQTLQRLQGTPPPQPPAIQ